jgi:two-component system NarL family sensor kinase
MKMKIILMKILTSLATIFLFVFLGTACSKNINEKANNDTAPEIQLMKEHYEKARKFIYSAPDSCRYYALKAGGIADSIKDMLWQSNINILIGVSYARQSDYNQSLDHYLIALKWGFILKDSSIINCVYGNLGILNKDLGNYSESINYYYQAIDYTSPSKVVQIGNSFNNLSTLYTLIGNYSLALQSLDEAMKLFEQINDSNGIETSLQKKGIVYLYLNKFDSSEYYLKKSLSYSYKLKNKYGEMNSYLQLGNLYLNNNKYLEAEELLNKAMELSLKTKSPIKYCNSLECMIKLNTNKNDLAQAMNYVVLLDSALSKTPSITHLQDFYITTSKLYVKMGKWEDAYNYLQKYNAIVDSMKYNQDIHQIYNTRITDLTYQIMEDRLKIEKSELEISQRNNTLIIIGFSTLIIVIGSIMLILRNKRKYQQGLVTLDFINNQKRSQVILETELAERKQLANDLHDGIGPLLSIIKLNLSSLFMQTNHDPKLYQKINQTSEILENIMDEVRAISDNLAPKILMENGLIEALRYLIESVNLEKPSFIAIELKGEMVDLPLYFEYALFRSISELLSNAIRHSNATKINLLMESTDNELIIILKDNGIGFKINDNQIKKGLGIQSTKLRIENIKGSIVFQSLPYEGTTIIIKAPTN